MASVTLAGVVSVGLQLGLQVLDDYLPTARPVRIQKALGYLIGAVALIWTTFGVALYSAALRANPVQLAAGFVALGLLAPLAGLVESRARQNGQAVYCTGKVPGTESRLPGHLLTNLLSGVAVACLVWVAQSTPGFANFMRDFTDASAFNIMLPLATAVIFAFVGWQQADACPDIDQRANEENHEELIVGFSLRHWHQLFNVLFMILALFAATTAILCLLAFAMERSKAGQPLTLSWQAGVGITVSLSFLYACGGPWSRKNRAVYLTFLTGTPAALCGVLVWLSWFRDDWARNIATFAVVGIGYTLYCIEAVLGSRNEGEKVHLHYFAATGVALVLVMLVGAMYAS